MSHKQRLIPPTPYQSDIRGQKKLRKMRVRARRVDGSRPTPGTKHAGRYKWLFG